MIEKYPPIFDYFKPLGEIADLSALHEDAKLIWQLPLRYLNDAISPARLSRSCPDEEFPSYLAYIQNRQFNAAIRHEDGAVAAGICAGLPMIAFQACRLFAQRMDETTGLPRCDEQERLMIFDVPLTLPTEWDGYGILGSKAIMDLERFEESTSLDNNLLATFMFDIAMRYVAMHECMHFVLGHARFCQASLGLDYFEDGSQARCSIDSITNQTLEFIADRHTVAGLVVDIDEGRLFHDWSRELPDFVMVQPKVWKRRVLVATLTLIARLWGLHGAADFGNLSNSYPHPYERVCWMVCGLSEMSKDNAFSREFSLSLALSTCSLDRNFVTCRQDVPLIERDVVLQRVLGYSSIDHGYDVVRKRAVEIQHSLYKDFGPYFPGIG